MVLSRSETFFFFFFAQGDPNSTIIIIMKYQDRPNRCVMIRMVKTVMEWDLWFCFVLKKGQRACNLTAPYDRLLLWSWHRKKKNTLKLQLKGVKNHIFENEKMSTITVGVVPPSASIPLTCVSRVQSYRPLWSHRCHCSRHPWWLPWPSKWVICPWAMQERWENSALSHNVFDQKGSVSREVPWHFVTKRCGSNPKTTKRSLCASHPPPRSRTHFAKLSREAFIQDLTQRRCQGILMSSQSSKPVPKWLLELGNGGGGEIHAEPGQVALARQCLFSAGNHRMLQATRLSSSREANPAAFFWETN